MANGKHPHILLIDYKNAESYTPKPRRIVLPDDVPFFDQQQHGQLLDNAYRAALEAAQHQYQQYAIDPAQADQGVAVELRFRTGTKIDIAALENAQGGARIEVLNVRLDANGRPESAILYIPPGRREFITNRLTLTGTPKRTQRKGRRTTRSTTRLPTYNPLSSRISGSTAQRCPRTKIRR
jgi:hypothetical protein